MRISTVSFNQYSLFDTQKQYTINNNDITILHTYGDEKKMCIASL